MSKLTHRLERLEQRHSSSANAEAAALASERMAALIKSAEGVGEHVTAEQMATWSPAMRVAWRIRFKCKSADEVIDIIEAERNRPG